MKSLLLDASLQLMQYILESGTKYLRIETKLSVILPCENKGKVFHVKCHVVEIEAPSVLSAPICKEMGLLARIYSLQQHDIPERPLT